MSHSKMSGRPGSSSSETASKSYDARSKGHSQPDNEFVSSPEEDDSRDSFSSVSFNSDSEIEGKVSLGAQKHQASEKRPAKAGTGRSNSSSRRPPEEKQDVKTNLSTILRDTRYFIMKSNNEENIELSKSRSVWSTPPVNESRINQAVRDTRNVILIFSVKESGKFSGFARLVSESTRGGQPVNWVLPPGLTERALGGVFQLDWVSMHDVQFTKTQHLFNPWNDGKPVKIGRDGQEIEPHVAAELCRLFPLDSNADWNRIMERCNEACKKIKTKRISGPLGGGIPSSTRTFRDNRMETRSRFNQDFGRQPRSLMDVGARLYSNVGQKRRYNNEPDYGEQKRMRGGYSGRLDTVKPRLRYDRTYGSPPGKNYSAYPVREAYHRPPPPPMPYPPPPPFDSIPPPPRYYDVPPLPDYDDIARSGHIASKSGHRRLSRSSPNYETTDMGRRHDRERERHRSTANSSNHYRGGRDY